LAINSPNNQDYNLPSSLTCLDGTSLAHSRECFAVFSSMNLQVQTSKCRFIIARAKSSKTHLLKAGISLRSLFTMYFSFLSNFIIVAGNNGIY